jgi:hypothetical protein
VADNAGTVALESVSFDPNLADPGESDGRFDTSRPDIGFMRQVVRETINGPPAAAAPTTTAAAPTTSPKSAQTRTRGEAASAETTRPEPTKGATSLAQSC